MRKSKTILVLISFLFLGSLYLKQDKEYILKSVFIEKFAKFTEWPNEDKLKDFNILVYGDNPIVNSLEKMAKKIKIKNQRINVKNIFDIREIENCHILFITEINDVTLKKILSRTSNNPVLTISESVGYCEKGVHINLVYSSEGTLEFQVNIKKLKQSGLKADMYLLGLGEIIEGE